MTQVYQLRKKCMRRCSVHFGNVNLNCLFDILIEVSGKELDYGSENQEIWARDGDSGVIGLEIFLKPSCVTSPQSNV